MRTSMLVAALCAASAAHAVPYTLPTDTVGDDLQLQILEPPYTIVCAGRPAADCGDVAPGVYDLIDLDTGDRRRETIASEPEPSDSSVVREEGTCEPGIDSVLGTPLDDVLVCRASCSVGTLVSTDCRYTGEEAAVPGTYLFEFGSGSCTWANATGGGFNAPEYEATAICLVP